MYWYWLSDGLRPIVSCSGIIWICPGVKGWQFDGSANNELLICCSHVRKD